MVFLLNLIKEIFHFIITNEFIKKENIKSNEIEIIFGQESKIIKLNDKEKSI